MKKHFLAALALGCAVAAAAANSDDPVLMTVDGHDIRVSEFNYLYNKNNTQQTAPQTLDEYLDMFIDYKLKVADAEHAGLADLESFQEELKGFRRDLAKPYMSDSTVTERLLREAYDRRATDVLVSHIMLSPEPGAREKIDSIRNEILENRIPFETAAQNWSVDRVSAVNGGRMGYVTPGRFPYAFEFAAYNTPVGQISQVVNSGVGYHIIRVESSQPTSGEVEAEHILLLTRGLDAEQKAAVAARMDSIYQRAIAGEDFQTLAREYSQDPGSARRGGSLGWFGRGQMVAEFDSAAFAIPDGAISQPFATNFGYHIIHRTNHRTVAPFEEMREQLLNEMNRDERANMPQEAVADRVYGEYHIALLPKGQDKLRSIISANPGGYDSVAIARLVNDKTVLATADGGIKVRTCDVMPQMPVTLNRDVDDAVASISGIAYNIVKARALDAYRENLAATNTEYRNLLNEYRDGILLYEISNRNVWNKATEDKEGLAEFFNANRDKYHWEQPKFKSFIVFASSDSVLNLALQYADSLSTDDPVKFTSDMRGRFGRDVKVERVIAARGENAITDYLAFDGNKPDADNKSHWAAYAAYKGRIIDQPEEAADVRGAAVTDYQTELDRRWVAQLRDKYKVKVNRKVFDQLKAEQAK